MNRKKIKIMLVVIGVVTALSIGNNLSVKAVNISENETNIEEGQATDKDAELIKNINLGKENKDIDGHVKEYKELCGLQVIYDNSENSILSLIKKAIVIDRMVCNNSYLNKSEIENVINKVVSNYEDSKVLIPEVEGEIKTAEFNKKGKLDGDEVKAIVDEVLSHRERAVQRVSCGNGVLEDFYVLGEARVNSENLEVINEYIKESASISLVSPYRVSGLGDAVKKGIAVYDINMGNNQRMSNALKILGLDVEYSVEEKSLFRIVEDEISINRKLKDGAFLSEIEIEKVVSNVKDNLEDMKVLVPEISLKIEQFESSKGDVLTSEEVRKIIDDVKLDVKHRCIRVCCGEGTLEDYMMLGECRVNRQNLEVINKYIKQNKNVYLVSDYRVEGLSESVSNALEL